MDWFSWSANVGESLKGHPLSSLEARNWELLSQTHLVCILGYELGDQSQDWLKGKQEADIGGLAVTLFLLPSSFPLFPPRSYLSSKRPMKEVLSRSLSWEFLLFQTLSTLFLPFLPHHVFLHVTCRPQLPAAAPPSLAPSSFLSSHPSVDASYPEVRPCVWFSAPPALSRAQHYSMSPSPCMLSASQHRALPIYI